MSDHVRYDELAVGYALAALEPADEQLFLAHLPGCAACERALVMHLETLSHLAYAAPDEAPPPALLDGIRDGIARSGRAGGGAELLLAPVSSLAAARRSRTTRSALLRRGAGVTGVAAGLALVAALVTSNAHLRQNDHRTTAVSASLSRALRSLATGGSVERVSLHSSDATVQAVALLDGDTVALVVDGLARNDRSRTTYVLWERSRMGEVRAIGTFDVTERSVPSVIQGMHLDHATPTLASLVVTREQGRTAPARTAQPALLAGELPVDRA